MVKIVTDTTYDTPKGGTLTIMNETGEYRGGKRLYKVICSICSKDKELFPEITTSLSNWRKGAIPCGCSKIPKWKHDQYKTLLNRICYELNYLWCVEDSTIKGYSKLKLTCTKHDKTWKTTTVNCFLKDEVRCLVCSQEEVNTKNLKQIEQELRKDNIINEEDFLTRNYEKLDSKGHTSFINLHCYTCGGDIYSTEGLCNGIFPTQIYSLRKGHKPCRCNTSFRWNKDQREYQILKFCEVNNGSFVKWDEEFKGSYTNFTVCCDKGHTFSKTINEAINNKSWCKACALQEGACYGFYPSRVDEVDYLYIMNFKIPFKIGRSFEPTQRLSQLKSVSGLQGEILHLYKGDHVDVYNAEQEVLSYIKSNNINFYCNWTTEAFYPKHYEKIIEYIESIQTYYKLEEVT